MLTRRRALAIGSIWTLAAASGFGLMARHESTPGPVGKTQADWPIGTALARDSSRPNLVMFAHPRCPCTLSSLDQLACLAELYPGEVAIRIFFILPEGIDDSWEHTASWRKARAIPGIVVLPDRGGIEARRFGAATSGHVLLFGSDGRCIYSGGITQGRGVEVPNDRGEAVIRLTKSRSEGLQVGPTFGCPLLGRSRDPGGSGILMPPTRQR